MSDIRCPTCDSELDWGICRTCMYEYLKDKCDQQEAEIERLRKVVDAACQYSDAYQLATDEELLRIRAFLFQEVDALRELEGDDE